MLPPKVTIGQCCSMSFFLIPELSVNEYGIPGRGTDYDYAKKLGLFNGIRTIKVTSRQCCSV